MEGGAKLIPKTQTFCYVLPWHFCDLTLATVR